MEFNSNILEVTIGFFGYSFTGEAHRFARAMQITVLIMSTLVVVQSSVFVIKHGSIDSSSVQAFSIGIISIQSLAKTFTVFLSQTKLKEVIQDIDAVSKKISIRSQLMFSKESKKFKLIGNSIFVLVLIYCVIMYIMIPLLQLTMSFITGVAIPKHFILFFWYPFDPYDYFLLIRIYNVTILTLSSFLMVSMESYIMLTYGKLSVLFKSLAEDIIEIVNGYNEKDEKLSSSTEKSLVAKIQQHVELVDATKKITETFELAYLLHMLCFAGSCGCTLLNFTMAKHFDDRDSIDSVTVIAMAFEYFFYICYFGEIVAEGVS